VLQYYASISLIRKFWRIPLERGHQTRLEWGNQAIFYLYASISRKYEQSNYY